MDIYNQDIFEINDEVIKKIIANENGKRLIDKIALGIKRVIENAEVFKDIQDNEVKGVYKFSDLDLLTYDFKMLRIYTDALNIDFLDVLDSSYEIIAFINIKKDSVLDRPDLNQVFYMGKLYFPSYLPKESWNEIFKKHILEKIKI